MISGDRGIERDEDMNEVNEEEAYTGQGREGGKRGRGGDIYGYGLLMTCVPCCRCVF